MLYLLGSFKCSFLPWVKNFYCFRLFFSEHYLEAREIQFRKIVAEHSTKKVRNSVKSSLTTEIQHFSNVLVGYSELNLFLKNTNFLKLPLNSHISASLNILKTGNLQFL